MWIFFQQNYVRPHLSDAVGLDSHPPVAFRRLLGADDQPFGQDEHSGHMISSPNIILPIAGRDIVHLQARR